LKFVKFAGWIPGRHQPVLNAAQCPRSCQRDGIAPASSSRQGLPSTIDEHHQIKDGLLLDIKDDPDIETHSVEVEGTDRKVILFRPKRG
jgi:hypothetical protein